MKRKLLIIVLISINLSTHAGNSDKKGSHPEIKFGAEAGLNMANIIYHYSAVPIHNKFILAGNAGAYLNIGLSNYFSFQPELLYSLKGTFYPQSNPGNTIHLNYIEIPLLIKYNVGKGFNFLGGPYVGYLLNLTSSFSATVYSNSKTSDYGVNTFDIGTVLGIEHQWKNGFNIGVKYVQGLSDIYKRIIPGYSNDLIVPANNLVFSLNVGWTFLKF